MDGQELSVKNRSSDRPLWRYEPKRIFYPGGMVSEGSLDCETLDEALRDLEKGFTEWTEQMGVGAADA